MKMLKDCFGHFVRLTDERLTHILEHPEMKDMGAEIEHVLAQSAKPASVMENDTGSEVPPPGAGLPSRWDSLVVDNITPCATPRFLLRKQGLRWQRTFDSS